MPKLFPRYTADIPHDIPKISPRYPPDAPQCFSGNIYHNQSPQNIQCEVGCWWRWNEAPFHLNILNWWMSWKGLKFLRRRWYRGQSRFLRFWRADAVLRIRTRLAPEREVQCCQSAAICRRRLNIAIFLLHQSPPEINFLKSNLINFRANLVMKPPAWQIHIACKLTIRILFWYIHILIRALKVLFFGAQK